MENSIVQLIPEPRRAGVETALTEAFRSTAIDSISLLAGGLSGSAVYKIVVDGRVYVLKLDVPSGHSSPALMRASEAGIAPRVYYREASTGVTITEFIESRPIRAAFAPGKLVGELARTIRAIHAIPSLIPGPGLRESIAGIIRSFTDMGVLKGGIVEEGLSRYEIIEKGYPWDDSEKVFSHNDINPGNLLTDGVRLWVVDWDAAFSNDRYVDLATAANFFVQTEEQELEFLQVYFDGAVDEYKRARFHVMRQVSRLIYSMLLVQVADRGKPAGHVLDQEMEGATLKAFGELVGAGKLSMGTYEGQLMYGKAQMNEAVRNMRLPRFTESIGML
ncbi:MAG TPA: phosphotransferase [Puia sp.]